MQADNARTTGPPIIVVGTSAGGVETVRTLLANFPGNFAAAIAIVIHRAPIEEDDRLPRVLGRDATLPVSHACDGEVPKAGHVYIAPAGFHLEIKDAAFRLTSGPKENGSRPSIDVLFRSATSYGRNAIGVILSGALDDGTLGLAAIKAAGGFAIVQDPDEAPFGDMPRNALRNVRVDAVKPVAEIPATILALTRSLHAHDATSIPPASTSGNPTRFSCPDCGGVLSRYDDFGIPRYVCRTGHAYSSAGLYNKQQDGLEYALWAAVRALEERAEMSTVLARRLRKRDLTDAATRLESQARVALQHADVVRDAMGSLQERVDDIAANDDAIDV